jgi:hypothetical protein
MMKMIVNARSGRTARGGLMLKNLIQTGLCCKKPTMEEESDEGDEENLLKWGGQNLLSLHSTQFEVVLQPGLQRIWEERSGDFCCHH